eukprot:3251228-Pyramimonas_sp.AAC.1
MRREPHAGGRAGWELVNLQPSDHCAQWRGASAATSDRTDPLPRPLPAKRAEHRTEHQGVDVFGVSLMSIRFLFRPDGF